MIGFIKTDGTIVKAEDYSLNSHYELEKYLKLNITGKYLDSIHYYKFIRINDGCFKGYEFEIVAELPDSINSAQLNTLENWLDDISCRKQFVFIEINSKQSYHHVFNNESNTKFYKQYYFKEYTVDDIIKDIKRNVIIK